MSLVEFNNHEKQGATRKSQLFLGKWGKKQLTWGTWPSPSRLCSRRVLFQVSVTVKGTPPQPHIQFLSEMCRIPILHSQLSKKHGTYMHKNMGFCRGLCFSDVVMEKFHPDFLSSVLLVCFYTTTPPTPPPKKVASIQLCRFFSPWGMARLFLGKWRKQIVCTWMGLSSLHMSAGIFMWW